ncbi:MAG: hypothetical protein HGA80_08455 [Candidatus Omnitrophica bacterium]|nr:hypothetical protein [Candidatus Omnitrophota bacterium]
MSNRKHTIYKVFSWILLSIFSVSNLTSFSPVYAQSVLNLPLPGTMVMQSDAFAPVMLRAVKIHPDQPLVFDFIVDTGNTQSSREDIRRESEKIAKYFLASLTIPEKDLWVNLSPYENNRIIPEALGQTEMGRDLLAQDYILKQLSASLVHPDKDLGKAFWSRVYERAQAELGTTDIPASTFNKIWIVPDKAVVYENKDTALVGESHFKIMLEQDYLAMKKNLDNASIGTDKVADETVGKVSKLSSDVVRDIVIPEIEKEVNTGKNFALLRQIQNALILATWYKENLKESLLAQVYADQRKVAGVDLADKTVKDQIYEQYIAAYREGVFSLIREDQDPTTKELLPRKYFSGGYVGEATAELVREQRQPINRAPAASRTATPGGDLAQVTVGADGALPMAKRTVYEAQAGVVSDALDEQNLQVLAKRVADAYGKTLKYENKEIANGVSFSKEGSNIVINFEDGSDVALEFGPDKLVVITQHDSVPARNILVEMLTKDQRFASTGYSAQVTLESIKAGLAGKLEVPAPEYSEEMAAAVRATGVSVRPEVIVVDTGAQESFGSVYLNGKMYVERAFLTRVKQLGNPAGMLTRSFIFNLSTGTWVEKKQKEFTWMQKNFARIFTESADVSDLMYMREVLLDEVNKALLKSDAFNAATRERMGQVFADIDKRIESAVAVMGVQLVNKEINNNGHVFFPLAADPLHFGQIDTMLRAMFSTNSLYEHPWRLQGADFRKILTLFTEVHRKSMMQKFLGRPELQRFFNMPMELITSLDGETQILEYLINNVDAPDGFIAFYLVGTDHMHLDAPDKKLDVNGLPLPKKMADGSNQPDTIRKLLKETLVDKLSKMKLDASNKDARRTENIQRVMDRLTAGSMKVVPAFNERSPLDSIPTSGEQEKVQAILNQGTITRVLGLNIPAASSTAIRNALAGIGDAWALALLPKNILDDIMSNDQYRGWAIKLSDTIKKVAAGEGSDNDKLLISNWINKAKDNGVFKDIDLSDQDALAGLVANMFTLPREQISQDIQSDPEFQKVFKWEDVTLEKAVVAKALQVVDAAQTRISDLASKVKEQNDVGGIDLNANLGNMKVERTGDRVKVTVDPAMLERIRTQGVAGFRPVIINIMPITSMFPALGLNEPDGGDTPLAKASG